MNTTPASQETLGPTAVLKAFGGFLLFAMRRFLDDRLSSAVAALTYTTLLAIVPILVIVFAILSSFPAFDTIQQQFEGLVFDAVVPETGAAIRDYLARFTRNAGDLTTIGVVGLAVSALFLLATVEATLNQVWHVEHPRPLLTRVLMFWAVLTLGPLVIGASITLTSDFLDMVRGLLFPSARAPGVLAPSQTPGYLNAMLSVAITAIGLCALFVLVPARHVRVVDAAAGALFAAVAFEFLAASFNAFILSGRTYETIYGAVVAVPVFLVWLYASWTVVILGAVVAASLPDWRASKDIAPHQEPGPTRRLEIALRLLARLYRQSLDGGTIAEEDLIDHLPAGTSQAILEDLMAAGYLVTAENGGLSLARDPHSTTVATLASDIRATDGRTTGTREDPNAAAQEPDAADLARIDHLLSRLDAAELGVLGVTLASLFETALKAEAPQTHTA